MHEKVLRSIHRFDLIGGPWAKRRCEVRNGGEGRTNTTASRGGLGFVLLFGCDKTTTAQLIACASADIPAIVVPGGPMLGGRWRDRRLGACTDGSKLFDMYRAGQLSEEQLEEIEGCIARSAGHCGV